MWKIFDDYYLMKRYPVLLCTKPLNLNYEWCWKDSMLTGHTGWNTPCKTG